MSFLYNINTTSNRNNIVFTLLLGSVLAGSLINSKLFVYSSLTAYFLFAILIVSLTIVAGGILLANNKEQRFSFSLTAFIFWALIAYSCVHGLILYGYLNSRHNYLLLCGLLLLSTTIVALHVTYILKTITLFKISAFSSSNLNSTFSLLTTAKAVVFGTSDSYTAIQNESGLLNALRFYMEN